jgi:predicted aconitase with swiveling domain
MVFNTAKGGVASAWMLHEMKSRGIAPKAILFNNVNPIWRRVRHLPTWRCAIDSTMATLPA